MAGAVANKNAITLHGSTEIVAEFFHYVVHSILYQRGIYPPESFKTEQKYGLTLLVSKDKTLIDYLDTIFSQIKDWLTKLSVKKLVLVISNKNTGDVLERWQFDVSCDKSVLTDETPREKSDKEIKREIQDIIRQVTASVTFLPFIEVACSFNLLIYVDKDSEVPEKWEETEAQLISNSEEVRLRSFSTTIHRVDSMVAYKADDE